MYRGFRINLPLANTNYNLFSLLQGELGQPEACILPDRVQQVMILLDPEGGYIGALIYIGDFRLSNTEYGYVVSASLPPFVMGSMRGNTICLRDYYLRTDTPMVKVLVNVEST